MTTMFHVSARECRQSIKKCGLDNRLCETEIWSNNDDWDDGVYLWENLELAVQYSKGFPVEADFYQVDTTGLDLHPDNTGHEKVEGAWHVDRVPSDKVRRLDLTPIQFIEADLQSQFNAVSSDFLFSGGNVYLDVLDQGDTILIESIVASPERAGLGSKVIGSLIEYAKMNQVSIRAKEVLAPDFFSKFGFIEDDDADEWAEAPDFWFFPPYPQKTRSV